jgi:RNA polymerase sigma-70 factor, ECF subfamily
VSSINPSVTQLLREWDGGDRSAMDRLIPLVYDDLRRLAGYYMRRERPEHTLQPTALVNEAYLRLVGANVWWKDRAHFLAVFARLMRRLLVDHARSHQRGKRADSNLKVSIDEAKEIPTKPSLDLVALDRALTLFATFDPRKVEIIELHFFGRLSNDDVAEALGISRATVQRELRLAKAWLKQQLT